MYGVRALLFAVVSVVACVSGKKTGSESASQYVISREVLAARPASSIFDIVAANRPQWLQDPLAGGVGGTGLSSPEAYADGRRLGPLTVLRSMSAGDAEKVCYFRPTHAQSRFGLTAQRAVVEVFTRGTDYARRAC